MNPYKLKNVFEYLTSNNQLLKKKLKLGTSEIPIPPKRDDVTTIKAINRFSKANPRVDTTNLQPLSVKQSKEPDMKAEGGRIGYSQGSVDPIADSDLKIGQALGAYRRYRKRSGRRLKKDPVINFDKFFEIYAKENFADGGRIGYKDGPKFDVQASGSKTGKNQIIGAPEGITIDSESINAIIKADIPITQKIDLLAKYQYGKGRNRINKDDSEIFLDEGGYRDRNVGIDFNRDGEGVSGSVNYGIDTGEPQLNIRYKKSFADGGMLVQPSDDGSRPGYKEDYPNVYKNKQGNYVYRSGKGDNEIYRSGFKTQEAASKWGKKEFVKKFALPNKFVNAAELSEILDVGSKKGSGMASPLFERADRPKYLLQEARKILGSYQAGKNDFFRAPTKKEIAYLKKYSQSPVITEGLAKNVQIILNSKAIMNDLTGKNKGGAKLPDFNKMIQVFKKNGLDISDAQITNALQKAAYVLRGDVYQSDVKFDIDKNTGRFIVKELEKLPFDNQYARGIYKHALNEIRLELGETAGNLESFKRNFRKKLPDGFLKKHNLNVNEVFSVRASANNKSFPYAYFVDVIDADLNKKDLRSFHGALSKAQKNLNDKINDIRAGKGKYDEAVDIVNKFQETRGKFKNTIETNYPNKNFNLADIVLGKESEIVKQNMKIPENVYSKKLLTKWADQGLDIVKDAKSRGFVMTGADSPTVYTAKDLSSMKFNIRTPEGRLNMKKLNTSVAFQKFLKENGIVISGCGRQKVVTGGRITFSNGTCGGFKNADEFAKGDPDGFLNTVKADPKASQLVNNADSSVMKNAFAWAAKDIKRPTGWIGGELAVSTVFTANALMEGKTPLEALDQGLLWFLPNDILNSYKKSLTEGMSEGESNRIIKALDLDNADRQYLTNQTELQNLEKQIQENPELFKQTTAEQIQNSKNRLLTNIEEARVDGSRILYDLADRQGTTLPGTATTDKNITDAFNTSMDDLFIAQKQKAVKDTNTARQFDIGREYQKYLNDIIMPDIIEEKLGKGDKNYQDFDILGDKSGLFTDFFPSLTRPFAPVTATIGQAAQGYASTNLPFADKLQNYLENIAISRNKKYLTEPTTMDNLTQEDFNIANQYGEGVKRKYASGGIASLTDTIPPESGPTPHGLPYVYNNVKKI